MTVDERRKKKGRSDGIIIAHSENLIRKVVRNMPHYDPSDTRIILEVFRDYNLHIGTVNYSMTYSSSCVQSNSFTRALRNFHMGLSTIVETTLAGVGGEKRENRSP